MTNARDMTALGLLEAHSKAQQKTIELLRVELASAKECWAEALENVATRNREIERLRGQLNFANREPPHCPSCNCGALEPNPALPIDPLDGWEGMESAPKDGTRVLALVTQKQFYRDTQTPNELIPVVVRWGGEYQEWSMPGLGGLRPTLWKPIELSEKSPAEPNAHEAIHAFARRYGLSRETVVAIAQDLPTYDTLKANAMKSRPVHDAGCASYHTPAFTTVQTPCDCSLSKRTNEQA